MTKLFGVRKFENFAGEILEMISERVAHMPLDGIDIAEESVKIAGQYKLEIPEVDKHGITSELKLEDAMGRVYQENPNAEYGKSDVIATATFVMPIKADRDNILLLTPPNLFVRDGIDIKRNDLEFKIRINYVRLDLPEEKKTFIKDNAREIVSYIEEGIKELSDEVDKFQRSLPNKIYQMLSEKQKQVERQRNINKSINPF